MEDQFKSYSPEIEKKNIYFLENSHEFNRLIVQLNDKKILENLIKSFVVSNENFKILLKITSYEKQNENKKDIWERYYGEISKDKLLNAMDKYNHFIFHDGYNEFLIKNSLTNEYICLDEYGCLWYYINSFKELKAELNKLEIKEVFNINEFIIKHFYYRMELNNQEKYFRDFINEFNMKYVEKNT